MSAPSYEDVIKNQYTNGPANAQNFLPDRGEIIVAKNGAGETLVVEDWDGNKLEIPTTHSTVRKKS